jgi:hypothetical protein
MKKHSNLFFACAIMGIFALAGCQNSLTGAGNQVSSASGAVVVTIETSKTADANGARTIHPALDGFTRYELSFEGPTAHPEVEISADGNPPIELTVGSWTITATAYNGEAPTALGSVTVEITNGGISSASITLGPVTGGMNGTLRYSVTTPTGAEGNLTARVTASDEVNITLMAGSNEDTLPLPAGEYLLFVSLTKAGNHAGRTEALHIYSGMTSEASYTFTEDDFIGVETLNPVYAAFTGAVGATAMPSNTAAITIAQGGNIATFAIVGGGTGVATIDAATGELTLVETGEITVSLVITTASGVVTHMGTSSSITVTKEVSSELIPGVVTAIPPTTPDADIDLRWPMTPVLWLNGTITASVDNYEEFTGSGSYSGDTWALQGEGRRISPTIEHDGTTVTRYNFTSTGSNISLLIQLDVSSEYDCDFAFVGNLDSTASITDYYYDRISGNTSKTITISVPTAGNHFVEIGYGKDGSDSAGSDCAWFTIEQSGISWYIDGVQVEGQTFGTLAAQNARDYSLGIHRLTVIATKSDGKSYSKTVNFTIIKE